jgi:16S rRNA (guanine966-N2)-methyltransferase
MNKLSGCKVLDLFAGSGALGIEALSRGASSCLFVEDDRDAVTVIEENIRECELQEHAHALRADALQLSGFKGAIGQVHAHAPYDLVMADPPYSVAVGESWLMEVADLIASDGVLVLETSNRTTIPESWNSRTERLRTRCVKTRGYGDTVVRVFVVEQFAG